MTNDEIKQLERSIIADEIENHGFEVMLLERIDSLSISIETLSEDAEEKNGYTLCDQGMTLRDYFAAKAMQGQISAPSPVMNDTAGIAKVAYIMADAMLKARKA